MEIATATKKKMKYTPESRRERGLPLTKDEVFILLNTLYEVTSNQ